MRILVDMDDVLEQMVSPWISALNDKYDLDVQFEKIDRWEISDFYPSLSREQVYEPLGVPEFWDSVTPMDGAVKYIQKLQQDWHEVYVVTASEHHTIEAKMEGVLFRYFPFIDWGHVIVTSHKQLIRGDVLVDDGIHNLIGGDYFKILMDRPYNRYFDETRNGMYRAKNWDEVYNVITMYADEISKLDEELEIIGAVR